MLVSSMRDGINIIETYKYHKRGGKKLWEF